MAPALPAAGRVCARRAVALRRRQGWARAVCGAGFFLIWAGLPLASELPAGAAPPGRPWTQIGPPRALVAPCDQFDPASPAASARITLDAGDRMNRGGREGELRSFVETGSIGRVAVAVIGATPPGVVRHVSAIPEISRISPYFGERLKGIALDVAFAPGTDPVRVVLAVRQVCARHFYDTFLHY
jgi:hypothetical protein